METETKAATKKLTVRCQFCDTWNRIDAAKVTAGPKCGKCGKPILLEPIMKVENITPDEYQGDICGDLSRRRGSINSIETRGHLAIIHAEVPLAELFGYATAIRSLSKGRSSYSMEPSHFQPVPGNLVPAILDQKEAK